MMTSASPVLVPREDPVGKILFAVVALAFGLACFVALITLISIVLRRPTKGCRRALEATPWAAFAAGVLGFAALGGLTWYLVSGALVKRILGTEIIAWRLGAGIAVALALVAFSLIGAAGTVSWLGARLADLHGGSISGLRSTVLATVVAVLAGWFPGIGWFVVMPGLLLFSLGAAVIGTWRGVRPA